MPDENNGINNAVSCYNEAVQFRLTWQMAIKMVYVCVRDECTHQSSVYTLTLKYAQILDLCYLVEQ